MASIKQIDGYKIYMNKLIGKGSYGAVYEGVSDRTGQKVAVKILPKSSIDADEYLKNALFSEIKILESIKSENVVGFYDVMESSKNYYLVQELCDGGDLSSVMRAGQTVNQKQAKQYLLQISNGFLALIREGIIHRDLKPANIMIKGGKLKIGDFGFAKKTQTASKISNQTIVGTPLYMSLQVLKSQPYSSKCDIWALGFIFFEMLHGYPPWNGKSEYDLVNKIETRPLQISEKFSANTKDFLKKTLEKTEEKRISWDQLFVHPIFDGYFLKFSKGSQEFQNKLKTIMSDLRFQINSHNLDLCKILAGLGYKNEQSQLDRQRFYKFLQIINPDITPNESNYIFTKTDYDHNNTISINQIQKILNENNINISTVYNKVPGFQKESNNTESFTMIHPEVERKIKACFGKLMRDIQVKGTSLREVFQKFDVERKGRMSYGDFGNMIKAVGKDIGEDQIKAAFDLIDEDGSRTVEFKELENYYTKVNGILPGKNNNQNKMEEQHQYNNNNYNNYNNVAQQQQNNQQSNQNNQNNLFNSLQGKNQNNSSQQQGNTLNWYNNMPNNQYNTPNYGYPNYGQPYPQQPYQNPMGAFMGQNYNQPQMFQQPYNPYLFNQPQQSQQPQQSGGLFDNFIFNQLSNTNRNNQNYGW